MVETPVRVMNGCVTEESHSLDGEPNATSMIASSVRMCSKGEHINWGTDNQ